MTKIITAMVLLAAVAANCQMVRVVPRMNHRFIEAFSGQNEGPFFTAPVAKPASSACGNPFTDSFTGSGALSACWSNVSSMTTNSSAIVRASGVASENTTFSTAGAIVSGGSFPNHQYVILTLTAYGSGANNAAACILMNSSGNGYCAETGGGIWKMVSGAFSSRLDGFTCGSTTVGQTFKFDNDTSGNLKVYLNGSGSPNCTANDTTYTSGTCGMFININSPTTAIQLSSFGCGTN